MKFFSITTSINYPLEIVWKNFDFELFKALIPKFPKTNVLRFDGCNIGDEVHTVLLIFGRKQHFYSRITQRNETKDDAYFTDEGIRLSFFLKTWKHKHIIKKCDENTCEIIDEISFSSHNKLLEVFFYPFIYAQLLLRKPIYKKFFSTNKT